VDADSDPATPCVALLNCGAGQEVATPPTPTTQRVCRDCVLGQLFNAGATPNQACQSATACTAGAQYQTVAATLTSDRQCASLLQCEIGVQVETVPPTATSNRQCSCDYPRIFLNPTSQQCQGSTVCNINNHYETVALTPSSDRTCHAATAPCHPNLDKEIAALTPTSDRVCKAITSIKMYVGLDYETNAGSIAQRAALENDTRASLVQLTSVEVVSKVFRVLFFRASVRIVLQLLTEDQDAINAILAALASGEIEIRGTSPSVNPPLSKSSTGSALVVAVVVALVALLLVVIVALLFRRRSRTLNNTELRREHDAHADNDVPRIENPLFVRRTQSPGLLTSLHNLPHRLQPNSGNNLSVQIRESEYEQPLVRASGTMMPSHRIASDYSDLTSDRTPYESLSSPGHIHNDYVVAEFSQAESFNDKSQHLSSHRRRDGTRSPDYDYINTSLGNVSAETPYADLSSGHATYVTRAEYCEIAYIIPLSVAPEADI